MFELSNQTNLINYILICFIYLFKGIEYVTYTSAGTIDVLTTTGEIKEKKAVTIVQVLFLTRYKEKLRNFADIRGKQNETVIFLPTIELTPRY